MADLLLRGAVRLVGITVRWRETPMTGAVRDGGGGAASHLFPTTDLQSELTTNI